VKVARRVLVVALMVRPSGEIVHGPA
jgi:hypothetical protein